MIIERTFIFAQCAQFFADVWPYCRSPRENVCSQMREARFNSAVEQYVSVAQCNGVLILCDCIISH